MIKHNYKPVLLFFLGFGSFMFTRKYFICPSCHSVSSNFDPSISKITTACKRNIAHIIGFLFEYHNSLVGIMG